MSTHTVKVILCAFESNEEIRHLPEYTISYHRPINDVIEAVLDNVYTDHQNGCGQGTGARSQALKCRSLSVGDLVAIDGRYYGVSGVGFRQLDNVQVGLWLALSDPFARLQGNFERANRPTDAVVLTSPNLSLKDS